ncbi:MAG: hypothetical protein U0547_09150 [Dehalococcoidia bacterium]
MTPRAFAAAAVLAIGILAAACGGSSDPATPTPANSPTVAATSTVAPAESPTPAATPATPATSVTPAPPLAVPFDDASDPVAMLLSFYDAVNRHDYARAYRYLRTPAVTEAAFAAGYADTVSAFAILRPASGIDAAAGNRRMVVAAVIDAVTANGSRQRFAGCYSTWRAAEGVSENPRDVLWHIEEAQIAPVAVTDPIPGLLDHACDAYAGRIANVGAPFALRNSPLLATAAFFDAIRRADFERARSYVVEGKRPPLADFRPAWANASKLTAVIGPVVTTAGAAGTVYARALAVFVDDAGVARFGMCVQLQRSNMPANPGGDPRDNDWSLGSTGLDPAAATDPARALALACH